MAEVTWADGTIDAMSEDVEIEPSFVQFLPIKVFYRIRNVTELAGASLLTGNVACNFVQAVWFLGSGFRVTLQAPTVGGDDACVGLLWGCEDRTFAVTFLPGGAFEYFTEAAATDAYESVYIEGKCPDLGVGTMAHAELHAALVWFLTGIRGLL